MIYRHPYILKYVSTWEQGGRKFLATEKVRPLEAVLQQQSDIQICLGLRTVLCSLIFLIEKVSSGRDYDDLCFVFDILGIPFILGHGQTSEHLSCIHIHYRQWQLASGRL